MKHEIKDYQDEKNAVYFRTMNVESGLLYNFWNIDKDDYNEEWIFVPNKL